MYPKYYLDMFTDAIEPTKVFVGMSLTDLAIEKLYTYAIIE